MDKGREEWTAGELRGIGVCLSPHIPDCAVAKHSEVYSGVVKTDSDGIERAHVYFVVTISQPFDLPEEDISYEEKKERCLKSMSDSLDNLQKEIDKTYDTLKEALSFKF